MIVVRLRKMQHVAALAALLLFCKIAFPQASTAPLNQLQDPQSARGQNTSPSGLPADSRFMSDLMSSFPPKTQILPLYGSGPIPNSKPVPDQESIGPYESVQNVSRPTIQLFLPAKAKANGTSIVVLPGGGYVGLSMPWEGPPVAQYFQDHGTAAFLVKYRLPSDTTMQDKSIGPLQDAQQAIRFVRQHAKEWNLDPARVGVIGFSAGGHLASTLGTHFEKSYIENPDNVNLRPDYMILVYPVISMNPIIAHMGSRNALLGPAPSEDQVKLFSNDLQVTAKTPPTLILQAADDHLVDVDNSIVFFEALRRHEVPVDLTIFSSGEHGFFLLPHDEWMNVIERWMEKKRLQ